MRRHFWLLLTAGAVVACRGREAAPPPPPQPPATPPAAAPADVSHGEAPVGSTTEPAPVDPAAPVRTTGHLRRIRVTIRHAKVPISQGVTYDAWTFDGHVPGPVWRVTVGDTVDFTI